MAGEQLKLVKRLALAFERGDLQTALESTDPHVRVYPRSEEPGVKQVYEGHDGVFEYLGNWYSQWDDTRPSRSRSGRPRVVGSWW